METLPFYRIKQLVIKKMGEEKFKLGCAQLSWWLSVATKENYTIQWVLLMCETTDDTNPLTKLKTTEAKAMKEFFKLQSYRELYTLPENTPDIFQIQ